MLDFDAIPLMCPGYVAELFRRFHTDDSLEAEERATDQTSSPLSNPAIFRGTRREGLGRLSTHAYNIVREAPCPAISV